MGFLDWFFGTELDADGYAGYHDDGINPYTDDYVIRDSSGRIQGQSNTVQGAKSKLSHARDHDPNARIFRNPASDRWNQGGQHGRGKK